MIFRSLSESTPRGTAYRLLMANNQSPDLLVWFQLSLFFCFEHLTFYLIFPSSDSPLKNFAGTLILMLSVSATPAASNSATQSLFIRLKANWNPSKATVRLLIHGLRQPTFFFSSLFSAILVDLPRSCMFRTGIA